MPNATQAQLAHFIERSFDTMSLGGVTFWINPQSFKMTTEAIHQDMPTRGGQGRFHYGMKPNVYTMSGTTGTTGYDGPGGLRELERFRPKDIVPRRETLLAFYFPNRFSGRRWVYVNSFTDSLQQDSPLFYYYDIELIEYGKPALTSAIQVVDESIVIPLKPGNNAP